MPSASFEGLRGVHRRRSSGLGRDGRYRLPPLPNPTFDHSRLEFTLGPACMSNQRLVERRTKWSGLKMRMSLSILTVCLVTSACASNGRPPQAWHQALNGPASGCASVTGSYANVAELPKPRDVRNGTVNGPTLTGLLGFTRGTEAGISKVGIAISNDGAVSFTRILASGESFAGETRLKPTCGSDGTLSWSGSVKDLRTDNLGDPLAGVENISYEFRRGSDGALYVTSREYGAGLIYMFLPFGYRSTDHYRFPAAD